jgi:methylmalonyl-CoA mutase N-terminal domain/subunit
MSDKLNNQSKFYRDNIAGGQQGLSVAFDLPTHRGSAININLVEGSM